ncbi:hypothetical protein ACFE04_029035 [Oxalis oulophora]
MAAVQPISGVRERHQKEIQNLTLTTQPFNTFKYFVLAITQYLKTSLSALLCLFLFLGLIVVAASFGGFDFLLDGPHEMLLQEIFSYLQFGLWWMALGVASSIGLGSGLHTFVLYLGPHIALFTIKAAQCGRVDMKRAMYDTIQFNRAPSWLNKECSEYGPPLFDSRVPVGSILPHVQFEAILWGIGTALGELPPYFLSRAARISGNKMKELDYSTTEETGMTTSHVKQIKNWFRSHAQYLNFFTILALASIPNPLFDLAGIMCGQFGIPFWKFFFATLIGKAIIKTHIQTIFIISVCNNQLLDLIENKLIWVLSFVPGLAPILPNLVTKLHAIKDKYMAPPAAVSTNTGKKWGLSLASIWNTVVWLMLLNFSVKIVTATAQSFLKERQEKELSKLSNDSSVENTLPAESN